MTRGVSGQRGERTMVRSGFTLLEILLALALVAMLAGSIFGFLFNVLDRREALLKATADAQAVGAFFEVLEADLACAIAGDVALGAGIRGDAHSLHLLSRRAWAPMEAGERDAAVGDLQVTEYSFNATAGVLNLRRRPARESGEGGRLEPICERVEAMRLRYFDGQMWTDSFDSRQQGALPVALEVAIWLGRGGATAIQEDVYDEDAVAIPARAPDRVRIISIPDGPTTWWKEAR
jgi:type II secretion system protein J